jgi:hypothetical protein
MTLQGIEFGTPGTGGGASTVPVPNVTGKSRDVAERTLEGFGFKTEVIKIEIAGTEDEVSAQDPAPSTTKPKGSEVRIFAIKNPVPQVDFEKRFTDLDTAVAGLDTAVQAVGNSLTALDGKVDSVVAVKLDGISQKLDKLADSTTASKKSSS